jgi:hypothetical protein
LPVPGVPLFSMLETIQPVSSGVSLSVPMRRSMGPERIAVIGMRAEVRWTDALSQSDLPTAKHREGAPGLFTAG